MPWALFPICVGFGVVMEPMRSNLIMGQINTFLILLIVADCLVPWRRWPRGVLIGIAAAIKLTPLVFLILFFVRRDWKALFTTVGSFVAVGLIGFAFAPRDSLTYWLHTVINSGRIGNMTDSWNQSMNGSLIRMGIPHERRFWAAAVLVMIILATIALWRTRRREDIGQAVLITAALQLLISPVSWAHHWDWAALFLIWCVARSWERRRWAIEDLFFVAFATIFWIAPYVKVPFNFGAELHWTWWQRIPGESFVLSAIVLVVASALGWGPRRRLTEAGAVDGSVPAARTPEPAADAGATGVAAAGRPVAG
jgi:alpha-1,2-mannosyltransferase